MAVLTAAETQDLADVIVTLMSDIPPLLSLFKNLNSCWFFITLRSLFPIAAVNNGVIAMIADLLCIYI
jgi:hypothetical protein